MGIWCQRYFGLPHTDDTGKFIWAYIMDDVMNWANPQYKTLREHRSMYIGHTKIISDRFGCNLLIKTLHLTDGRRWKYEHSPQTSWIRRGNERVRSSKESQCTT